MGFSHVLQGWTTFLVSGSNPWPWKPDLLLELLDVILWIVSVKYTKYFIGDFSVYCSSNVTFHIIHFWSMPYPASTSLYDFHVSFLGLYSPQPRMEVVIYNNFEYSFPPTNSTNYFVFRIVIVIGVCSHLLFTAYFKISVFTREYSEQAPLNTGTCFWSKSCHKGLK